MSVSVGGQATIALVAPLMWLAETLLAMSQKEYGFLFFGLEEEALNKRWIKWHFKLEDWYDFNYTCLGQTGWFSH